MLTNLLTVASLLAVSTVHGCMSPDDLINTIELEPKHVREAFNGLDIERDDAITEGDLAIHYWHTESEFAISKFLHLVDSPLDKNTNVDVRELGTFMEKKPVKLAVHECTYLKSKTMRSWCFADELLTFVYLVLDHVAVGAFFTHLESSKDHDMLICYDEIKNHAGNIKGFTDTDIQNLLLEIGKDDKRITKEEFTDYVLQEDLHDDFRTCRKSIKPDKIHADYNMECLVEELFEFTKNHMTELDVATTFDDFDKNDDRYLKAAEIMDFSHGSSEVAKRFIKLMDKTGDSRVSYGEFRAYIKSHTVKIHLEKECSQKDKKQEDEIKCYKEKIIELVDENHVPPLVITPNLDMLFVFEELDFSNDGRISVNGDLVVGRQWEQKLADKFVEEMDGTDADKDVSLEEFNEYVDEPHMVYGIADCLSISKKSDRLQCYITELKDMIRDMLTKDEVDSFFKFYDTNDNGKLTKDEIKAKGVQGPELDYFVKEIAYGDEIITKREFTWYVRQQEVSDLFKGKKSNEERHTELLHYLADYMTVYDITQLFFVLDKDHDMEITASDFLSNPEKINHLIQKMDKNGDGIVNFIEFWVYLNSPINNIRKKFLEKHCTTQKDTQEEEIKCYKEKIHDINY